MEILILIGLFFAVLAYLYRSSQKLSVDQYTIYPEGYTGPGLKLLFFSDFHLGQGKSQTRIEAFVAKLNSCQADLIIFGGDLFSSPQATDPTSINRYYHLLRPLRARLGIYAIQGNHDAHPGEKLTAYQNLCARLGWQLLEDQVNYLEDLDLLLVGLRDAYREPGLLDLQAEPSPSPTAFRLCLIHEPDVLALTPEPPGCSLVLSGHSHAGQISLFGWLPVLPKLGRIFVRGFYLLPELDKLPPNYRQARKAYGLKVKPGQSLHLASQRYAYVSPGCGTSHLPLRFMAKQSCLVLEIKADPAQAN